MALHNELSGSFIDSLNSENLHYIVKKLAKYQPLSLQDFAGFFCSCDFQSIIGRTNVEIIKFLKIYPEIFKLNEKGKVCLSQDLKESDFGNWKCSISSFPSGMPADTIKGEGKVKQLFATYGFLVTSTPITGFAYFTAKSFYQRERRFSKFDLRHGDTVGFEARKCARHMAVEYYATHVWYIGSPEEEDEEFRHSTKRDYSAPRLHRYNGKEKRHKENNVDEKLCADLQPSHGFIQELYKKHGFIQEEKGDRRFHFHLKDICNANNCSDLLKILKIGDIVQFTSLPSKRSGKWIAEQVWIGGNTSVSAQNSDEEIFVSDSEFSAAENDSQEEKHLEENTNNSSVNAVSMKRLNNVELNTNVNQLYDYQGKIYINSETSASVKFGSAWRYVVFAENCPVYVNKKKVDNWSLEFVDGDIVNFDAVKIKEDPDDIAWQAVLLWTGEKPDVPYIQTEEASKLYSASDISIPNPADAKLSENFVRGDSTHVNDSTKEACHENDLSLDVNLCDSVYRKMPNDSSSKSPQKYQSEEQDNYMELSVDSADSNAEDTTHSNEYSGEECVDEENTLLSEQDCYDSSVFQKAESSTVAESLKNNKPGVFMHNNLKGKIIKLYRYIAQINCSHLHKELSILLNDVYLDGVLLKSKCTDPRLLLNEGDDILFNCFEIVDDEGDYWQKVTLSWIGDKPKHIKECEPSEFIEKQELKVSCVIPEWRELKHKKLDSKNSAVQAALSTEGRFNARLDHVKSSGRRGKGRFLTPVHNIDVVTYSERDASVHNEKELRMVPAVPEDLMNQFHSLTENMHVLRQTACSSDVMQSIEKLCSNMESAINCVLLHLRSTASTSNKCKLVNKSCQTDRSID